MVTSKFDVEVLFSHGWPSLNSRKCLELMIVCRSLAEMFRCSEAKSNIGRAFKINNTWSGFHNDVRHLTFILRKNLFPTPLIDKVLHRYITRAQTPSTDGDEAQSSVTVKYFKHGHCLYKAPWTGRVVSQFIRDLDPWTSQAKDHG